MNDKPDGIFLLDPAIRDQYQAWDIGYFGAVKLFQAGFTPEVLAPYMNREASLIIDNTGFSLSAAQLSSIPSPKRRKSRRQAKPLKKWQMQGEDVGEKRIPIHKGK